MTARYMITVADGYAPALEAMLGAALVIGNAGASPVPVASLDGVSEEETKVIRARLATGGPLYHAGGPA